MFFINSANNNLRIYVEQLITNSFGFYYYLVSGNLISVYTLHSCCIQNATVISGKSVDQNT